jgi:hypothetical protein
MMVVMNSSAPSGGKIVVLGIFGVALLAATAGLFYKYFASQQPIAMWGPEGIQTIQKAAKVELLELTAGDAGAEDSTLKFGSQTLLVKQRKDISKAQGLIHHRHFLTEAVSYTDQPKPAAEPRAWTHAIRFEDGSREVTVLFDLPGKRLANLQAQREVSINPRIAENWQRFIDRNLPGGPN